MSVKLLLNPAAEARECTHEETGITFLIRPISPGQYDDIRRKSLNQEKTLNIAKWGENFAAAAIAGWGDEVGDANGPLECTEANARLFGKQQAVNIMPWIIERATSLDHFRTQEEAAAKNA